jgi:hypothetical protein
MQDLNRTLKPFLRAPANEETRQMIKKAAEGLGLKVVKVELGAGKIVVRTENGIVVVTV